VRRCLTQLLLPGPFRISRSHMHTPTHRLDDAKNLRVNVDRRRFHSGSHLVTTNPSLQNTRQSSRRAAKI
jgi:hypothetical protein